MGLLYTQACCTKFSFSSGFLRFLSMLSLRDTRCSTLASTCVRTGQWTENCPGTIIVVKTMTWLAPDNNPGRDPLRKPEPEPEPETGFYLSLSPNFTPVPYPDANLQHYRNPITCPNLHMPPMKCSTPKLFHVMYLMPVTGQRLYVAYTCDL